jgi:hypothetical protein
MKKNHRVKVPIVDIGMTENSIKKGTLGSYNLKTETNKELNLNFMSNDHRLRARYPHVLCLKTPSPSLSAFHDVLN